MKLRITKSSVYYIILFLFCVIDLNFLYLIDVSKFNIMGVYYSDFVFLLSGGLVLLELVKNYGCLKLNVATAVLVGVVAMALISAFSGTVVYVQPFLLGLVSQREWVSCMMLIYPISSWLKKEKITIEGLKKMLFVLATIYVSICIAQYILTDVIQFTYAKANIRYGEARYYFDTLYLMMISGFVLDDMLKTKSKGIDSKKLKRIALLFCIGFTIIIVTKGRMSTISWICGILICILIQSEKKHVKKIVFGIAAIFMMFLFLSSEMGQDIMQTVMGENSVNDTLSIRDDGRIYYWGLLLQSTGTFFFGLGSPNLHWVAAQSITNPAWNSQETARLYLSDQGITGIAVMYGVLGIAFWVIIIIYCLKCALRIYKTTGRTAYLQFLIVEIMSCISLTPTLFYTSLVFPIYLVMLTNEVSGVTEKTKLLKKEANICELSY